MAFLRISSAQQLYVAFYGRPADPAGQTFWDSQVGRDITDYTAIIEAFGNSPEAQGRFESLPPKTAINVLFNAVLGRDADPVGLTFYLDKLSTGQISLQGLAVAIVEGIAVGSNDAATFLNRVAAADRFTKALDTPAEQAAYNLGEGRNLPLGVFALTFLNSVTANPDTIPSQAIIAAVLAELVPADAASLVQSFADAAINDWGDGISVPIALEEQRLGAGDPLVDQTPLIPDGQIGLGDQPFFLNHSDGLDLF